MSEDRLLQEIYAYDPWRVMVCCILLNKTTRTQVDAVRERLFDRYKSPDMLARAQIKFLTRMIAPLGLQNTRARALKRLSAKWEEWNMGNAASGPPVEVLAGWPGIGEYAADSYRIFCLGEELSPSEVEDKELKKYLEGKGA